ncbi:MAG: hypothetical protein M1830_001554 [Pleopsidium flavum]|nr:MAG: hypothetical protein M1830_001554 [Pleopsidium flavum]
MPRPRRKSSGLGADIRGDTSAPAVSTLEPMPTIVSPPLSPRVSESKISRPSKRRKARSLFRQWKDLSFKHTWVNPLILIILTLAAYAINPSPSNPISSAILLSYPLPRKLFSSPSEPIHYGKGPRDVPFVAFYIVVLSFAREVLMQRFLRPMAIACGIRGRAKQSRFMEQVYTAMYFSVFGPYGLYVMSRTPVWYFNITGMLEGYPHQTLEGVFKAYYLLQASYWAQQAIVLMLQLEKPRKDFKELVGHHIITLILIGSSYRFHFTHMGLAVYITHDISDFFLATSKTLNYLDHPIVGPYFALFVIVWVYARHYLNLRILYATLTDFRTVGPFVLDWDTGHYKSGLSQVIAFTLLASLQAVNLFWLFLILRIARNYLFSSAFADVRSDNEDDDEGDDMLEAIEGKDMRTEKRKEIDAPRVLLNGNPVERSALRKEGESFADVVKDNCKKDM